MAKVISMAKPCFNAPARGFGHGRSQHAKPNQRPSQICCMQNQCTPKLAAPFPSFLFFQQLSPSIKSHRRRGRQPREPVHIASSRGYGSELLGIAASLFRAAPSSSPEGDAASDVKARRRGSGGPGPSERDGRRSRDLPSSMAGGTQEQEPETDLLPRASRRLGRRRGSRGHGRRGFRCGRRRACGPHPAHVLSSPTAPPMSSAATPRRAAPCGHEDGCPSGHPLPVRPHHPPWQPPDPTRPPSFTPSKREVLQLRWPWQRRKP